MIKAFIERALNHPAFPILLVAVGLAISLPGWRRPFSGDDLVQAAKLLESHPLKQRGYFSDDHRLGPATLDLFDWFRPGSTKLGIDGGVLPWWTPETAQQSFWRPLSAATHWLDYQGWPSRSLPMRVHSVLWFAAYLVVARALYRRLAHWSWAAGLAALILAINQENWQALAWIAARNSLITAFFLALTLWLHRRHARSAFGAWALAAWASFAAGLLAGEGAVTTAAYLFSYTLFLDRRPWRTRILGLAPYAIVAIAWRVAYRVLGFGVAHSGLYVDPASEPARYLLNLLEWGPLLLLDVITSPILGKYASLGPGLQPWAWGLGLGALLALAAAFVPMLRAERAARFWALGLVLSVVPACATTAPDDRITLYAMFGFAPLAAGYMAGLIEGAAWLPRRRGALRLAQGVGLLLAALHLLQPLPGHARRMLSLARPTPAPSRWVDPILLAAPDQTLVLINPPEVMYVSYLPYFILQDGAPLPECGRMLTSSLGDTLVRRTATNTLEITAVNDVLIPARVRAVDLPAGAPRQHPLYKSSVINTAFREEGLRFAPGDRTLLPGMSVEILRVNARGLPAAARFTFAQPLDSPRYHWVYWDAARARYLPWHPPAVESEQTLPGPLSLHS